MSNILKTLVALCLTLIVSFGGPCQQTLAQTVQGDADSNGALDIDKGGTNAQSAANARTALGVPAISHNQAWSTITSTPTTLLGYGITDALAPDGNGSALIGLLWSQIGSTPTSLSGYGILDGLASDGNGSALIGLLWSQIGDTPTTLSGYGITDGLAVDGNGSQLVGLLYSQLGSVPTASTSVSGILSSTDWNTFNGKQAALGFTPQQTSTNLDTVSSPNANRVFYVDENATIVQLALGPDGTFLRSNGATVAPSFSTPSGAGDVLGPSSNTDLYVPQWNGPNSKTLSNGFAVTTFAKSFLDDADATVVRTTLGLPTTYAPIGSPYLTTTADGTLTGESNLGALTTGLLKITVSGGTATPSTAASSTDYAPATSGSAILKGNGTGGFSSASAGTDYIAPDGDLSDLAAGITGLVKGAGNGLGYSAATAGSDYPGLATSNTWTGAHRFGAGSSLRLFETGSTPTYYTLLQSGDLSGNATITFPAGTGTLARTIDNVATATALAANGSNCNSGYAPLGVDASGAAESCFQVQAYSATLASLAGLTEAAGTIPYATGDNAYAVLAAGTAGKLMRFGSSNAPTWSTVTIPDTVAAGSVLAANSANTLAAVNSTSGTYYLRNVDGTVSWAAPAGTGDLKADGTIPLTANWDMGNYNVEAREFKSKKQSGVAGALTLFSDYSTEETGVKIAGPHATSSMTQYKISLPLAEPLASQALGIASISSHNATATWLTPMLSYAGNQISMTNAGASGGIPYYSASNTQTSTPALTQYGVVYGGGVGGAPVATTAGTTGQVLRGSTGAAPSFGQVVPSTDLSTFVPGSKGGTGVANNDLNTITFTGGNYGITFNLAGATNVTYPTSGTLMTTTGSPAAMVIASQAQGDLLYASSASAWSRLGAATAGNPLISGGASANPSYLGIVLAGGTNTFSITNGTASLDVAAAATLNIDTSLTVQTGAVTLTGNAAGSTLVLPSGSVTLPSAPIGGTFGATANTIGKRGADATTVAASKITDDGTTADFSDLNLVTTGTISGKLPTVVNDANATYTVSTAQARAGTFFLTTYSSGTTTYVLPAAEAGMSVCAKNGQNLNQALRADTDGTDYLVLYSTGVRTTSAGDYVEWSASPKNQFCAVAYNATDWYITSEASTGAEQ